MKEKILPKLPYGQGSFSWRDDSHTTIKFQRNYKSKTDGKTYRLRATAPTVKECYALMEQKEAEKEEEIKRTYRHTLEDRTVILSDAIRDWMYKTKFNKNKANSFDRCECTLNNQIENYPIGRMQAVDVESKDIIEHLDYLFYSASNGDKKGYSYSTVKKTYELLDNFFKYYYINDINANPMIKVEKPTPKRNNSEITIDDANNSKLLADLVLSDDEIKLFKNVCLAEPKNGVTGGTKYGAHLYFMLLTFLRVGEAITLIWSDVNFEKRTLRVNKSVSRVKDRSESKSKTKIILTTPKTIHGDREVVLTDEAIQILNIIKNNSEYTSPKDYIFSTAKGTMVTSTHLYKVLKGVLKAANLNKDKARDKFTLHYLRHTGISFYIRHGVPIDIVSSMAGHADTSITRQIYYHIIEQQREEAMTKMNAIKI